MSNIRHYLNYNTAKHYLDSRLQKSLINIALQNQEDRNISFVTQYIIFNTYWYSQRSQDKASQHFKTLQFN